MRPLRAIRVLLCGGDPNFLRVASRLLHRAGFVVETSSEREELLRLVGARRPDIVVLDGSQALGAAARSTVSVEALHPAVRVLLVADGARRSSGEEVVLPKWESLPELPRRVRLAYARAGPGG